MDGIRGFFVVLWGWMLWLTLGVAWADPVVCGNVLDAYSRAPVAQAVVSSGSYITQSSANGAFCLRGESALIQVRAPGFRRAEVQVAESESIALEPFSPRALYLSFFGIAEPVLRDPALELLEDTRLNALVIDVKGDRGMISFPSSIELADDIGAQKIITLRNPQKLLASLKERGIYTIARVVVFKDNLLAKARPELAVRNSAGRLWKDGERLYWVDPFAPEVWDYNIAIAEEAAALGFDEIQFDYVRFPARKGLQFSHENTQDTRVTAITDFLAAARKRLEPYNVFLSADIFGYVCWNENDTSIGQQLEEVIEHLDYISPMLYPSGFTFGVGPYRNPVKNPFQVISLSLKRARDRTGLPAVRFRPWLQAFRDYAFDRRKFDEDEIRAQVSAAEEFGANGWMLWNARNVYNPEGIGLGLEARAETEKQSVIQ